MRFVSRMIGLVLACALGLAFAGPARADSDADVLLTKARFTFESMIKDPNFKMLRKQIILGRGVLIIPNQLKAAFVVGAQGGSGVLIAKDSNGVWGYPAFYTIGTGSVGFQIGFQDTEAILVIMTDRGLNAVVNNQVKLGIDLSAAVGPVGEGIGGATTTAAGADVVTFARNSGLFLGGSLDGAAIIKRQDWNREFYGPAATPSAIIFGHQFANPAADKLRADLQAVQ